MERALGSGFVRAGENPSPRPALSAQGKTLTRRGVRRGASRIGATIQAHPALSTTPLATVFVYRPPVTFAGALGSSLAGRVMSTLASVRNGGVLRLR